MEKEINTPPLYKQVMPYEGISCSKKEQVAKMFDNIASRYDFLNRFLSFGIDRIWRRRAIRLLKKSKPSFILDVATGTADLAIEALRLGPEKIIGVDISEKMLKIGKKKILQKKLDGLIELKHADSENLPFSENTFDAVTVAFGVRNFENTEKGLREMCRVLKAGGKVVILEFSRPVRFPVKQLYALYFKWILPVVGRSVSGDKVAYTYLPESVNAFPEGEQFIELLKKCGFRNTFFERLTFGIASVYFGEK